SRKPSAAFGASEIRSGSTLYGTSSTSVPSLSRKIALRFAMVATSAASGPGTLLHRQDGDLGDDRFLRQHRGHGTRGIHRILQLGDVEVGEAVEQEWRA